MRTLKEAKKPSKLRDRFKMLIDSLREKQNFKDKLTANSMQQVNESLKSQLDRQVTDIFPVTQDKSTEMKSHGNSEFNSLKGQKQLRIFNNSSFAFIEDKQIQQVDRLANGKYQTENQEQTHEIVINNLSCLNPEIELECPSHEGRIGTIRNQLSSVNARFRQKNQVQRNNHHHFRYMKKADKHPFKEEMVPTQVLKEKVEIKQINDVEMVKFWNLSKKLSENMSFNQYSAYFEQMNNRLSISINQPLVKKYKNCVYFGQNTVQNAQYQGIIYYFDEKIYYGEFVNGIKHGHGIQINFKNNTKYVGNFNGGKKNGYFFVQTNQENYEGILQHGLYHGKGKLMTQEYTYVGSFQDGKRHGYGQEHYPKTGLKLAGYFNNGIYQNLNQKKSKKAAASQPQLQNKLDKIVASSRSQMVDFRIDLTTKLLRNQKSQSFQESILKPVEIVSVKEVPFESPDANSLSDLLSNHTRASKYEFQASKITKRFPKIHIEGVKVPESVYQNTYQNETKVIINKKFLAQRNQRSFNRRRNSPEEQQKPLKYAQKASQFMGSDNPVPRKQKNNAGW